MTSQTSTWTLVANSHEAKIFSGSGVSKKLSLIISFENEEARKLDQDMVTDRPGRRQDDSAHGKSALGNEYTAPNEASVKFAKQLSQFLSQKRKESAFNRLILAAEPNFLGNLRNELDDATRSCVVDTLDKNIVNLSVDKLNDKLAKMIHL